jgi:trehalose-phosphatase
VELARELEAAVASLRAALDGFAGVHVEDKGLTASVHFRNAAREDAPLVRHIVESRVGRVFDHLEVHSGKAVFEVRPRAGWGKGDAARWIRDHAGLRDPLPVCMGDDETDEDLFLALPEALSVRVGGPDGTGARYFADDWTGAICLLSEIHAEWERRGVSRAGDRGQTRR